MVAATSSSPMGDNTVKEVLAAGGYATVKTLGSVLGLPSGVAVDGSGNVFVSNCLNNAVCLENLTAIQTFHVVHAVSSGDHLGAGMLAGGLHNQRLDEIYSNRVQRHVKSPQRSSCHAAAKRYNSG